MPEPPAVQAAHSQSIILHMVAQLPQTLKMKTRPVLPALPPRPPASAPAVPGSHLSLLFCAQLWPRWLPLLPPPWPQLLASHRQLSPTRSRLVWGLWRSSPGWWGRSEEEVIREAREGDGEARKPGWSGHDARVFLVAFRGNLGADLSVGFSNCFLEI